MAKVPVTYKGGPSNCKSLSAAPGVAAYFAESRSFCHVDDEWRFKTVISISKLGGLLVRRPQRINNWEMQSAGMQCYILGFIAPITALTLLVHKGLGSNIGQNMWTMYWDIGCKDALPMPITPIRRQLICTGMCQLMSYTIIHSPYIILLFGCKSTVPVISTISYRTIRKYGPE